MEAQTDETTTTEADAEHSARLAAEITRAFPPVMAGVMTGFEAVAIEFPGSVGGKALELRAMCGPMIVKLRVDPDFAEAICVEIMEAAKAARASITPADMTDVDAVVKQAEAMRGK